jgi:hypothetical protein
MTGHLEEVVAAYEGIEAAHHVARIRAELTSNE